MGIGGGFVMTIYLPNGTAVSLMAREMAPLAASTDMFRYKHCHYVIISSEVSDSFSVCNFTSCALYPKDTKAG